MNHLKKKRNIILKILLYLFIIALPWIAIYAIADTVLKQRKLPVDVKITGFDKNHQTKKSVDHSKFEILQKKFTHPSEVTEACVSCHNGRDEEIMNSSHWKWSKSIARPEGDTVQAGKQNAYNNYCVHISSNEFHCTNCHAGYGWEDKSFDFEDHKKVDCLVCHDKTGAYEKTPSGSGMPALQKETYSGRVYFPPNYNHIAQNVGKPDVNNCGVCHFYGGGGDNVKNGDLSSDLFYAHKDIDIHMDKHGNKMSCTDCHETHKHNLAGSFTDLKNKAEKKVTCMNCHSNHEHANPILDKHTNRVACQTCHIPVYAKGVYTNMVWDWSKAGKKDESGEGFTEIDTVSGRPSYRSGKGAYEWANYVTPEYIWSNGTCTKHILGDTIRDTSLLALNEIKGSANDPLSKIIPVKIHRGKNVYDVKNRYLIPTHVYGHDENAFDVSLNWDRAIRAGMEYAKLPYSGKYGFVSTEFYHPINHMVASSEQSLKCIDCHSDLGRLEKLDGFYMPGRDQNKLADTLGILMVFASIGGIMIHTLLRTRLHKNK